MSADVSTDVTITMAVASAIVIAATLAVAVAMTVCSLPWPSPYLRLVWGWPLPQLWSLMCGYGPCVWKEWLSRQQQGPRDETARSSNNIA